MEYQPQPIVDREKSILETKLIKTRHLLEKAYKELDKDSKLAKQIKDSGMLNDGYGYRGTFKDWAK